MLRVKEQFQHPKLAGEGTNETDVFSREPFVIRVHSPTTCKEHISGYRLENKSLRCGQTSDIQCQEKAFADQKSPKNIRLIIFILLQSMVEFLKLCMQFL